MITDDELIRLLELADPARVDDPTHVLEPAEYRDALNTRTTNVTLIDPEPAPTQPTSDRRWPMLIAVAAAVVLVVGALVVLDGDDATPADQPSPTVTVPPTVPARAMPDDEHDRVSALLPGTYFFDQVAGAPTPRIFVTVGDGWRGDVSVLGHVDGVVIAFSRPVDREFLDACHPSRGFHPGPVDTLDGLVAALSEQRGWADVSAVSDISAAGYSGKAFQRTAPTEFSDCETVSHSTRLSDGIVTHPAFGPYVEPGWTETLWVLDIDGTVVLIKTTVWPGPSSAARADLAAPVLTSIRIDRSSSPEAAASEPAVSTPPILPVGGPELGVGPLAPDLGQFTDQATLIDALIASGPSDNQLSSDPDLRPGVSICADIVRYHEPTEGTLLHVANAMLNGQAGVVLVFIQPSGEKEMRMYGTDEYDPHTGCPLLIREPVPPTPATNPLHTD